MIHYVADDLGTVADALYSLPAEDFVAARDARAKQLRADGDRDLAGEVGALPKPTMAAWLLNQLARRRASAVEQLVGLGAELREAQQSLDGDQMRALTRQRHQVVRAFSRQVADLGAELGRPVSGTVADQVEETLRAAVADEEAGQALLSGRLTTAMSYVGMGQGSVSAAVAVPRAPRAAPAKPPPGAQAEQAAEDAPPDEVAAARERRRQAARDTVEQAEQAAERAVRELAERDQELAAVADRLAAAQERLEALRAELAQAEGEAAAVEAEREDAQARRHHADEATRNAARAAVHARRELEDLTGVDDDD